MPRWGSWDARGLDLVPGQPEVPFPGSLQPVSSHLNAAIPSVTRVILHPPGGQLVIVLLVANGNVPLVPLGDAVDQLHPAWAPCPGGRPFPNALASRHGNTATIAHQIHAHDVGVRIVFAAGRLGLGRTLVDQAVPLHYGILLSRRKRLLACVIRAEEEAGPGNIWVRRSARWRLLGCGALRAFDGLWRMR